MKHNLCILFAKEGQDSTPSRCVSKIVCLKQIRCVDRTSERLPLVEDDGLRQNLICATCAHLSG